MAELKDIIGYFCKYYPNQNHLSKARLTKLIYLADWKSSIDYNQQVSGIQWVYNYFGPYVDDVINLARTDPCFNVNSIYNSYAEKKDFISLKKEFHFYSISDLEKQVIDKIIELTKDMNRDSFIQLVYSTYPIISSNKGDNLDLVDLAKKYKVKS